MRIFFASQCSRTRLACWMNFKRVDTSKAPSAQACAVTTNSSRTADQTLRVRKIDLRKSVKKIMTPPCRSIFFPRVSSVPFDAREVMDMLASRPGNLGRERNHALVLAAAATSKQHVMQGLFLARVSSLAQRNGSNPRIRTSPSCAANANYREATCGHTSLESPRPSSSRSRTGHFSLKETLNHENTLTSVGMGVRGPPRRRFRFPGADAWASSAHLRRITCSLCLLPRRTDNQEAGTFEQRPMQCASPARRVHRGGQGSGRSTPTRRNPRSLPRS
jgi:hypothetical protein